MVVFAAILAIGGAFGCVTLFAICVDKCFPSLNSRSSLSYSSSSVSSSNYNPKYKTKSLMYPNN